jgi:DNA polymerase III delta subunit
MLIGLLTKTFGTLLRLRLLMDKGVSQGDIKNDLGISPWLFSKYLPLAKRVPPQTFLRALSALMVADFKLKDRSLGPNAVFSSLAAGIQKEL